MKSLHKKWLALLIAICLFTSSVISGNQSMLASATDTTTEITPITLEGFRMITTKDFVTADQQEMQEGEYTSIQTFALKDKADFDKTLLSLKVTFTKASENNRIEFCGTKAETGFFVRPQSAKFVMSQLGQMTSEDPFTGLNIEGTSVTSTRNEAVLLQISIEYKDYNADETADGVQLGIYLNGTKVATKDVENCNMANFGNCLTVYAGADYAVSVYGVEQVEDDDNIDDEVEELSSCYLENFKQITTSSFVNSNGTQMADTKRYEGTQNIYSMRNVQGNIVESFDRTMLSMKVKFEVGNQNARIQFAGKDSGPSFMIYSNAAGTNLTFTQSAYDPKPCMATTDPFKRFSAETAGLTSFLDEFILQISFEYESDNKVKLGFYFNGTLYEDTHHVIKNCNMDNFGNVIKVYCDQANGGAPITISSVVPANASLTELTWSDFMKASNREVAVDQIVPVMEDANDVDVYRLNNTSIDSMEDTNYAWKLMFEKARTKDCIYYAGTRDWKGMQLHARSDGNLWLHGNTPDLDVNEELGVIIFDKDIAGVETFINQEFKLNITTEFADYDGDGDENDVQLGFYFNGQLYNNQYLYAYDCKSDFGNYITLHPEKGCISLRSVTDEYEEVIQNVWGEGAYEFEATEEDILVNGKKSDESSIATPGDYLVSVGDAAAEKVILYSERDPHPDDNLDVRDLIATVKVSNGVPVDTWSGNLAVYAAGMDAESVRDRLLNTMESEETNAYSMDFIGGKDVMPIAGYYGPHRAYQDEGRGNTDWYPNFISDEYYKYLSDAGVNLIAYSEENYSYNNGLTVKQMLELGNKYGIAHFVTDSNIRNRIGTDKCEDITISDGVATIKKAATLRATDSADLDITDEMTIFMKIRVDSFPDNITLLSKGAINGKAYSVGIQPTSGNGLWFSATGYQNSKLLPSTAKWQEVAVVVKNGLLSVNIEYYSDSEINEDTVSKTKTQISTQIKANSSPLYIGNYTINGLYATDSIREYDDIRIYNKALTKEQIASITPNAVDADTTLQGALVAHWDFESDGTTGFELKDKATGGTKQDNLSMYDTDGVLYKGADFSVSSLSERIANYSSYDSFAGLYLVDEPTTDYYQSGDGSKNIANYKRLASVLQKDLGLTVFANMFPVWNLNSNQSAYEQYVEEYCETIQPKFLSWDNYPFDSDEETNVYFYNMSLVREKAQKYQLPFWATIQAGGQLSGITTEGVETDEDTLPTKGEFNWNVNTCLAFGVQGIDYYPLIQPIKSSYAPNGTYDYSRNGVIGADGSLHNWYYYAQEINTHIKSIDKVLMNSVNKGILVSGDNATQDTNLTNCVIESGTFRELQSVTGEAIVGCFNYNGKTALYVVNHNMASNENITLNFDKEHHVKVVRSAKTSFIKGQNLQFDLAAGEGALVVIE